MRGEIPESKPSSATEGQKVPDEYFLAPLQIHCHEDEQVEASSSREVGASLQELRAGLPREQGG